MEFIFNLTLSLLLLITITMSIIRVLIVFRKKNLDSWFNIIGKTCLVSSLIHLLSPVVHWSVILFLSWNQGVEYEAYALTQGVNSLYLTISITFITNLSVITLNSKRKFRLNPILSTITILSIVLYFIFVKVNT